MHSPELECRALANLLGDSEQVANALLAAGRDL